MNPIHSLSFPIKLVLSIWYLQRKAYNLLIVVKKKNYMKNTLFWDLKKYLKSNYFTMSNTVSRFKQLLFWYFIFSLYYKLACYFFVLLY